VVVLVSSDPRHAVFGFARFWGIVHLLVICGAKPVGDILVVFGTSFPQRSAACCEFVPGAYRNVVF